MVDAARELSLPVIRGLSSDHVGPNAYEGMVESRPRAAGRRDIALLLLTSGTTAAAKVVPLSVDNLASAAENIGKTLALGVKDRDINIMPLYHVGGLVVGLLAPLLARGSCVIPRIFLAPHFFDWIAEYRPTWYTATPGMHRAIVNRATQHGPMNTTSLRFLRSGADALPAELLSDLARVFRVPVIESYAMTEAASQITSNPLPPLSVKAGSVGLPAGCEVAVMDAVGQLLAPGFDNVGEVVIRGPSVFEGYDGGSENAFTPDGWFRTGDLGSLDADGYLYLKGRMKEVINRGGEKIAPAEVDQVLLSHPAVADGAAFGVPHLGLGEEVAAAIVVKDGKSVSPEDLQRFSAQKLSALKVPKVICFVPSIPRGPTGKVKRVQLASDFSTGLIQATTSDVSPAQRGSVGTRLERLLQDTWQEILRLPAVGLDQNFFDVGGDSLIAMQIVAKVQAGGFEVSLLDLFQYPTITELVAVVNDRAAP
jgi:acyl-CoA synthetase (AMP-forming)/AMP-acid ligase II/aryl carrier-like protein